MDEYSRRCDPQGARGSGGVATQGGSRGGGPGGVGMNGGEMVMGLQGVVVVR